jgi:Ran GTPase-activating protein (RanGAP) involved in mRNA processing and transport
VIDELQDRFGSFDMLGEVLKGQDGIKNLRWLLTLLLNEGADENESPLTEREVGKMIHTGNFLDVKTSIFKAFSLGSSGGEDAEQEEGQDTEDEIEEDKEDREGKNAGTGKEK